MRLFLQLELTGRHLGRAASLLVQLAVVVLLVYVLAGIGWAIGVGLLIVLIVRGIHTVVRGY